MTTLAPHLVASIVNWCRENGLTPLIRVEYDEKCSVPANIVEDGEFVLNLSSRAAKNLSISETIEFDALIGGRPVSLSFPAQAVISCMCRETETILLIPDEPLASKPSTPNGRPHLFLVPKDIDEGSPQS